MQLKSIKGKISKISSLTRYHFLLVKIQRNDNKFLGEISNWICWHLFAIREPLTIFNVIIWVLSCLLQCKILNPEKRGRFKGEVLGFFQTIEWASLEPGIYKYRIIKENVLHKYCGTEYKNSFCSKNLHSAQIVKSYHNAAFRCQ